jgi:hypothetical protein
MNRPYPNSAPSSAPTSDWRNKVLYDKLPHCFPKDNGDPASKAPADSPTKCLQELNQFSCDDIDQLIADAYKHGPPGSVGGMPTKKYLEDHIAPMINKVNKDKAMISALASAFVGSVDKLQCAIDSLNTAYELKGDDKLPSLPVPEIKAEMANALDCCKMCATSTKGIIIGVVIAIVGIIIGVILRFI